MGKRQILCCCSLASHNFPLNVSFWKLQRLLMQIDFGVLMLFLILHPVTVIKIIQFLIVNSLLAVMRGKQLHWLWSSWITWVTKIDCVQNKKHRSKSSILKVTKFDIWTAFFRYKFFITFPNEQENSGSNISNWSAVFSECRVFPIFQ